MSRIQVVAVDPYPAGLYGTAGPVGGGAITGPDRRAEPVQGVVGDPDGLCFVVESGDGKHRAEYLLLEDAHVVGALEHGGFHVIDVRIAFDLPSAAADQDFGA